jgi:hypothetical protein
MTGIPNAFKIIVLATTYQKAHERIRFVRSGRSKKRVEINVTKKATLEENYVSPVIYRLPFQPSMRYADGEP